MNSKYKTFRQYNISARLQITTWLTPLIIYTLLALTLITIIGLSIYSAQSMLTYKHQLQEAQNTFQQSLESTNTKLRKTIHTYVGAPSNKMPVSGPYASLQQIEQCAKDLWVTNFSWSSSGNLDIKGYTPKKTPTNKLKACFSKTASKTKARITKTAPILLPRKTFNQVTLSVPPKKTPRLPKREVRR